MDFRINFGFSLENRFTFAFLNININTKMELQANRRRKSEALTPDEHIKFKEYVNSFRFKVDCMEALDMSMPTLDRIVLAGTGRPDSIKKIREAIQQSH